MKYAVGGQVMIDTVVYSDGSDSGMNMGGPAIFGYAGVRLWTDEVNLNINVGEDFYEFFDGWLTAYGADRSDIHVINPHGNRHIITYRADGSYHEHSVYGWDNMHKMDPKIEDFTGSRSEQIKGIYLNNNVDCHDFWKQMDVLRREKGIKTMWEIPTGDVRPENMDALLEMMHWTDYVSINVNEGKNLWQTDSEEEVVQRCCDLPVEMTFLRAGEKGAYVIAQGIATFVPSVECASVVDPTGCGNCSTAVAMYGYTHTKDPLRTGIMANISASYNLRQLGPYMGYTPQDYIDAQQLLLQLYEQYSK